MSWIGLVLLVAAVALVAATEWPRIGKRVGLEGRAQRARRKRKAKTNLRVVEPDSPDDFAAAVQRDLANLPTYDPRDAKKN